MLFKAMATQLYIIASSVIFTDLPLDVKVIVSELPSVVYITTSNVEEFPKERTASLIISRACLIVSVQQSDGNEFDFLYFLSSLQSLSFGYLSLQQ